MENSEKNKTRKYPVGMLLAGIPADEQDAVFVLDKEEEAKLRSLGYIDDDEFTAPQRERERQEQAEQERLAAEKAKAEADEQERLKKLAEHSAKTEAARKAAEERRAAELRKEARKTELPILMANARVRALEEKLRRLTERKEAFAREAWSKRDQKDNTAAAKLQEVEAEITRLRAAVADVRMVVL